MIKQLTKEQTKELERTTTPLVNLVGVHHNDKTEFEFNGICAVMAISSWYLTWDLKSNKFKEHRDKLIQLLGFKPNYHVNYEFKNAVWGLESNGHQCVLYTSLKGTSLQVAGDAYQPGTLHKMLEPFMERILDWKMLESGTEKSIFAKRFLRF